MNFSSIACAACMLLPLSILRLHAQQDSQEKMPWQTDAAHKSESVQFVAPAQVTVAAHKPAVIELHFEVADGLHINSHSPHDKSLIPTQVAVADGDGLSTHAIDFPPGTDTSLPFAPREKLSVYTGGFFLTAHITAAPGNHLWQGILRYQACDLNQCMPPRKLPITVDVIAK